MAGLFEQGFERGQGPHRAVSWSMVFAAKEIKPVTALVPDGNIAGGTRLNTKGNAHQFGLHGIKRRGFCVDGHRSQQR